MAEPTNTNTADSTPTHGRQRVIIEGVSPELDEGRHAIKRVTGESVMVEANIFADGHDVLGAVLKYRHDSETAWSETEMEPLVNDRWRGRFNVGSVGTARYTFEAWIDHLGSWRRDFKKKVDAGLDVSVELLQGADLIRLSADRAQGSDAKQLRDWATSLVNTRKHSLKERVQFALDPVPLAIAHRHPDRSHATRYHRELRVCIDPPLAQFGAWYELFPRSTSPEPGRHGTFKDCEALLPEIARMGFDILYLPPIHPIGRSFRKGKNNNPKAEAHEPGSPWAIGAREGGHKAILPELGTLDDFRRLLKKAGEQNLTIALDIAFQCAPDHPYTTEHPDWFRKRPDGSIQYAENPPKKYQDIYPIDFETQDWQALWHELRSIFEFWIQQGVSVFRVDNPHTKAFPFWDWCISSLKQKHPNLIFLAEAFTRPRLLERLAKLGFTQSYNYFPWRNTKQELTEYLTELTRTDLQQYLRPNLWPNTPDILTQYLQHGGRPAFLTRFILAATLGAAYGIYGPAFEFCLNQPREPGSEEYLDSEKYEIRHWDWSAPNPFRELIARINRIRRDNPALHSNHSLRFHPIDNDQLIAYSKLSDDGTNLIVTVVNLDPHHIHHGWLELPLAPFDLHPEHPYQMHDLLTDAHYLWQGPRNYVQLDPNFVPAHVFRVRRQVRSERDFDYFL
jgi:starch synthase (maltosyl-transferring)